MPKYYEVTWEETIVHKSIVHADDSSKAADIVLNDCEEGNSRVVKIEVELIEVKEA